MTTNADEQLAQQLIERRALPTAGISLAKAGALVLAGVVGAVVWFKYFRR